MSRRARLNHTLGSGAPLCSLNRLNHSCVRDLAWCLTSPVIYHLHSRSQSKATAFGTRQLWHWLHQLDQQPEPLYQAIAQQRSHRIGIYFETLYGFALEQLQQPAELRYALAVRQQIRQPANSPSTTIGEYDFLHRARGQSAWCHTELSLKFYLGVTSLTGAIDWVGLNRNDRLIDKHNKMQQQQLQLSHHPQARDQLQQLGIQIGQRSGIIRGRLFYPFDQPQLTSPVGAQRNHLRGWWIKVGQQQQLSRPQHSRDLLSANTQTRLVKLSRRQWLAPLPAAEIEQEEAAEIEQDLWNTEPSMICLGEAGQPEMVARLIKTPIGWREHDRGVLVPDDWV